MKLKLLRPLYQGKEVVPAGDPFTTSELHGRELIRKGYAVQVGGETPDDADGSADDVPQDLNDMSVKDLRSRAKELSIENADKLKKAELVAALQEAQLDDESGGDSDDAEEEGGDEDDSAADT